MNDNRHMSGELMMKQKNLRMTMILNVLAVITGGVTVINKHWDESWKLFWYDLRNGFSGFGMFYAAAFVAVFATAAVSVLFLYWIWRKKDRMKNEYKTQKVYKYAYIYS